MMKTFQWFQHNILRTGLSIFLGIILVLGGYDLVKIMTSTKNLLEKISLTWGLLLFFIVGFSLLLYFYIVVNIFSAHWIQPFNVQIIKVRNRIGWVCWLVVLIFALIPPKLFLYSPIGLKISSVAIRLLVFLTTTIIMAFFIHQKSNHLVDWIGILVSFIILGSIFVLSKSLTTVVDHPLSLTWSEGNRIWDYSILFGRDLYNYPQDQPIEAYIDKARQTLWGLPFLFPGVSILHVRLWSAFLFTVPYALFGWTVFRFQPEGKKQWFWLGLWSLLFINQGPVYTPLILSAIMVAAARRKPMWAALPLIFLAGYYAQSSRINWMFGPAVWAVMVALGDFSPKGTSRFSVKIWLKISAYGLAGFFGGFGIFRGWLRIFNQITSSTEAPTEQATSQAVGSGTVYVNPTDTLEVISEVGQNTVFTNQPLIWERLFPNPTYGLGIILGILLAAGPLILLLLSLSRSKQWQLNKVQKLGVFAGLAFLLGLGILISTKIGGGGDLHNLDMFIVGLVFTGALAWESGGYRTLDDIESQTRIIKGALLAAVAIPAFMPWVNAKPLELPPEDKTAWTLELLQAEITRINADGGEILLMDQRQLLTFGYFGDLPLVPEYEKKLVMDRAMSGDSVYFEEFYKDIQQQRFALIVSDPQRIRFSEEDEGWAAENDTWVQWVSKPLLCYYEPVYTVKKTGVWLLVPIADPGDCEYP
jgi:hypothetical protein